MPTSPSDLWIHTDHNGVILDWSGEAPLLVGYSARSLMGRLLQIMFLEERPGLTQFARVLLGHPVEKDGRIRPRDQRAVKIRYRIELAPESTEGRPIMRWTFTRL